MGRQEAGRIQSEINQEAEIEYVAIRVLDQAKRLHIDDVIGSDAKLLLQFTKHLLFQVDPAVRIDGSGVYVAGWRQLPYARCVAGLHAASAEDNPISATHYPAYCQRTQIERRVQCRRSYLRDDSPVFGHVAAQAFRRNHVGSKHAAVEQNAARSGLRGLPECLNFGLNCEGQFGWRRAHLRGDVRTDVVDLPSDRRAPRHNDRFGVAFGMLSRPWLIALIATTLMQSVVSFMRQCLPVIALLLTDGFGMPPEQIGDLYALTSLGTAMFLARGGPDLR